MAGRVSTGAVPVHEGRKSQHNISVKERSSQLNPNDVNVEKDTKVHLAKTKGYHFKGKQPGLVTCSLHVHTCARTCTFSKHHRHRFIRDILLNHFK